MNDNPHGQQFPRQQIYSQADMDAAKATARADGYAAAVMDAANAIDARGAREQADFGLCRGTQNFYRAARLARSILPPDSKKGGA